MPRYSRALCAVDMRSGFWQGGKSLPVKTDLASGPRILVGWLRPWADPQQTRVSALPLKRLGW